MLDYVVMLTKDATRCSRDDHTRLRAVGFDDRGILQITLIASWFNYINRLAHALGVGREWGMDQLMRQPKERGLPGGEQVIVPLVAGGFPKLTLPA
jgi:uncharacterized protein YciW